MRLSAFDYCYPKDLVAQHPLPQRDAARMMMVPRTGGEPAHRHVRDLPEFLRAGDVLIINTTKVLPVRLIGHKESGGCVEVLLLKKCGDQKTAQSCTYAQRFWCLASRTKRLIPGTRLVFSNELSATVDGRQGDEIRLSFCISSIPTHPRTSAHRLLEDVIDSIGLPPLPPYIVRNSVRDYSDEDRIRYQTVFARESGSAAAPTAGLHLTKEMLEILRIKGVQIAEVILHVGRDTFQPVRVDKIADHRMHGEELTISKETANIVNLAKCGGRRVIAIGTTSVRALEGAWDVAQNCIVPGMRTTRIFITPGYAFRVIDGLLTNFHQPKSTLLMLVSALLGRKRVVSLYNEAIHERYRLFSFGDCMLIV